MFDIILGLHATKMCFYALPCAHPFLTHYSQFSGDPAFPSGSHCISYPGRLLLSHCYGIFAANIILSGFGNGLVLSIAFVALTIDIDKEHMAMVCSSFYLIANTGTAVSLAATGAVLQRTLRNGLERCLDGFSNKNLRRFIFIVSTFEIASKFLAKIIDKSTSSIDYISELENPIKNIVISADTKSFHYAHGIK